MTWFEKFEIFGVWERIPVNPQISQNRVPLKAFPNSKTRLIVKRKRWKNGDMLRSYERRSEIFSGILIGWGEARFLHLHVVYKTNMRWGKANLKMKTFICNLHICNLDQRMFSICMQGFSNTSWILYLSFPLFANPISNNLWWILYTYLSSLFVNCTYKTIFAISCYINAQSLKKWLLSELTKSLMVFAEYFGAHDGCIVWQHLS